MLVDGVLISSDNSRVKLGFLLVQSASEEHGFGIVVSVFHEVAGQERLRLKHLLLFVPFFVLGIYTLIRRVLFG